MNIPPITDTLPIALRAYAGPLWTEPKEPKPAKRKASRLASEWTVIFDTETTVDAAQSLRFGTYQVRTGDTLHEAGIFFDEDDTSPDERGLLQNHADRNSLKLITRADFIENIFFGIGYDLHATIVGFNLPFDIARLALRHGSARGKMRGGFTFTLSPDAWSSPNRARPHVQVKHISRRSAFIQFASAGQPQSGAGQRKKRPVPTRRGTFVDVRTLAGALYARSFSLKALGDFLKVSNPKLDFDEFHGPITDAMIDYAVRDVQTTWECFVAAENRYNLFGLKGTRSNRIYSEAGLGKAHLRGMNIQPWTRMQPDFPRPFLGRIMGSYFGGRSEVRIRREMRQVMLCDFLSMYPTVCILMGLWRFVIAKGMTWRDSSEETRTLLDRMEIGHLQSKEAWRKLTTLVRVQAAGDIFPVRAEYDAGQTTIGVNYLTGETPLWFTLADCIASKLLTGKAPDIVEAITFEPGVVQDGLMPICVAGNPAYSVDPTREDFYAAVIAMRQDTKRRMNDAAIDAERAALDIEQFALKIIANATSYGIFMEVNVEDLAKAFQVLVSNATDAPFSFATKKVETPGPYFHPLLGTLITGAARLMLAITERLIGVAGLDWAFCDTDSMAIAKPAHTDAEQFHAKVHEIVDWFAALNPHGEGSILKIEDVNFAIDEKGMEPLYVWAISAKRYALFNLSTEGRPIIRKASAHGLGHLMAPYDASNPASGIPAPTDDLSTVGVEHWQHDLWWMIVSAALASHANRVDRDYHAALLQPAISRYGATTPELLRWFKRYNEGRTYREQIKPFNFLSSLSAKRLLNSETLADSTTRSRRKVRAAKPIAPFDRDPAIAAETAFDRETGCPVPTDHLRSYVDALVQYHLHPEAKFRGGDFLDTGTTERRHIRVGTIRHIGKESADWEEQMYLGLIDDPVPSYGSGRSEEGELAALLSNLAKHWSRATVAKRLRLSRPRLQALLDGRPQAFRRLPATVAAKAQALADEVNVDIQRRADERRDLRATIAKYGLRTTARKIGMDPSNLRRKIHST